MLTYLYQHPFDLWLVGMPVAAIIGSFFTDWDKGETPKLKAGLRAGLLAPFWPLLIPLTIWVACIYVILKASNVPKWVFTDRTWHEAWHPEVFAARKKEEREKRQAKEREDERLAQMGVSRQ